MTFREDLNEAAARAIVSAGPTDPVWSETEWGDAMEFWHEEAVSVVTAILDRLMEPSEDMADSGEIAAMQDSGDGFDSPRDIFRAMIQAARE